MGFDATNDIFAEHGWYFRNALVRANYNVLKNGIHETTEYLERFLRNLLLNEQHELFNRSMHISGRFEMESEKKDDPINDPINISSREKRILEIIKVDPGMPRCKMAERLSCSDSTVKRALADMTEKGIIMRKGSRRSGYWMILRQ